MNKALSLTVLALLLSQQSLAQGFYLGGKYHGQLLNDTGSLEIRDLSGNNIDVAKINDRLAQSTEGQIIDKYKANYNPPFSASLAFGCAKQLKEHEYRIELEGIYSQIKVNNIGLTNGPIVLTYVNSQDESKKNHVYGMAINHGQIDNASAIANVYYYWTNNRFSFSPYIGAGIGGTRTKMFEKISISPAYQLKAGLNYRMTEDTDVHIGYRHFGVIGNELTLKGNKIGEVGKEPAPYSGEKVIDEIKVSNKLFTSHGVEVGMTIHFAS